MPPRRLFSWNNGVLALHGLDAAAAEAAPFQLTGNVRQYFDPAANPCVGAPALESDPLDAGHPARGTANGRDRKRSSQDLGQCPGLDASTCL